MERRLESPRTIASGGDDRDGRAATARPRDALAVVASAAEVADDPPAGAIIKPYGWMLPVYRDDDLEIVLVKACAGGYSSTHFHKNKHNTFLVNSGEINIKVYRGGRVFDRILTNYGSSWTIYANTHHSFEVTKDAMIVEIYRRTENGPPIDPLDIHRLSENGVRK